MNTKSMMPSGTDTAAKRAKKRAETKKNVQRFLRTMFSRKIVIVGAVGTLFFVLVAIFAPLIATHDPNFIENGQNHWYLPGNAGRLLRRHRGHDPYADL